MGVPTSTTALLLLGIFIGVCAAKPPYKLCSQPGTEKDCEQLERTDKIECVQNLHGVDCLLNIEQGKSDFGRVRPEEALIAANFVKNIVVLGEFRTDLNDDSVLSTAVLVRHDHSNGLKGLKGKKYCHPGFRFEENVSGLLLKEFENAVLKENSAEYCGNKNDNVTLLEKELKGLSEFFGPSCRPGPWIDIDSRNSEYYAKYKSLCELCIPNSECSLSHDAVPFMQSLDCLVNGGGDIALTTLNTIHEFFNKTENQNKQGDFKYLCRNGSVSTLERPCVWSKQSVNLIVAHRDKAESIETDLGSWLSKYIVADEPSLYSGGDEVFANSLKRVFFPTDKDYDKIKFVQQRPSVKDYLERNRVIPNMRDAEKCNTDVKWCTTSNEEQQKCLWLAQASLNNALQPVINCVESPGKLTCLEDIKNDKADVVAADAHYGYIARKKGLAPLAYPDTSNKYLISTVVVIKASSEQEIGRFENLKTKKACIPEYGGIEWLSFINTARERKVLSKTTCDYDELISNFVGDSCMPGAHDVEHEKSSKTNHEKLCSLCRPSPQSKTASTCNSGVENAYYGTLGALKCLKEEGDFAVITLNKEGYPNINEADFRILCKNGSLASTTGFNVDPECVLTTIVDSEVVSKRTSLKNKDIRVTLLNLEKSFGTDLTKAFEVFNVFNNTKDLLFTDSTFGLTATSVDTKKIKNYVSLFEHVDKCVIESDGNPAAAIKATAVLPLFLSILVIAYMNKN